jgi:hypothetical protein
VGFPSTDAQVFALYPKHSSAHRDNFSRAEGARSEKRLYDKKRPFDGELRLTVLLEDGRSDGTAERWSIGFDRSNLHGRLRQLLRNDASRSHSDELGLDGLRYPGRRGRFHERQGDQRDHDKHRQRKKTHSPAPVATALLFS